MHTCFEIAKRTEEWLRKAKLARQGGECCIRLDTYVLLMCVKSENNV